jgi:hypothetical protein
VLIPPPHGTKDTENGGFKLTPREDPKARGEWEESEGKGSEDGGRGTGSSFDGARLSKYISTHPPTVHGSQLI